MINIKNITIRWQSSKIFLLDGKAQKYYFYYILYYYNLMTKLKKITIRRQSSKILLPLNEKAQKNYYN